MTISITQALAWMPDYYRIESLTQFAECLPEAIRADDRFARAFKKRMQEIKESSIHQRKETVNV